MTIEVPACIPELSACGLLPDRYDCVFVAGSLVRGWGNASSDIDVYIITDEPWRGASARYRPIALEPNTLPIDDLIVDGREWDLKYWQNTQVEQTLERVSWARFHAGDTVATLLDTIQRDLLERLPDAVALDGEGWLRAHQQRLSASAFLPITETRELNLASSFVEDAVGQLQADDIDSAVLSAQAAFGHVIDALLTSHGMASRNPKWRARKVRAVNPDAITFEDYWSIQTMRTFDPDHPASWVLNVVDRCRSITAEMNSSGRLD